MKRLVFLAAITLAGALLVGGLARGGHFPRLRGEPPRAAYAETTVTLAWSGRKLEPARLRIPRDRRVILVIDVGTTAEAEHLTIPGYGSGFPALYLPPGVRCQRGFVTDRPGDGFEIRIGDRVAGRLDVLGDHLGADASDATARCEMCGNGRNP